MKTFHVQQMPQDATPLLTLRSNGTYELGGTVEDMLAHTDPVVRAFGAALRDQYEAGRRGDPAPMSGQG